MRTERAVASLRPRCRTTSGSAAALGLERLQGGHHRCSSLENRASTGPSQRVWSAAQGMAMSGSRRRFRTKHQFLLDSTLSEHSPEHRQRPTTVAATIVPTDRKGSVPRIGSDRDVNRLRARASHAGRPSRRRIKNGRPCHEQPPAATEPTWERHPHRPWPSTTLEAAWRPGAPNEKQPPQPQPWALQQEGGCRPPITPQKPAQRRRPRAAGPAQQDQTRNLRGRRQPVWRCLLCGRGDRRAPALRRTAPQQPHKGFRAAPPRRRRRHRRNNRAGAECLRAVLAGSPLRRTRSHGRWRRAH